jgi:hypothetical protein
MMRLRSAVVLSSVMAAGTITPVAAVEPGTQSEAAPATAISHCRPSTSSAVGWTRRGASCSLV